MIKLNQKRFSIASLLGMATMLLNFGLVSAAPLTGVSSSADTRLEAADPASYTVDFTTVGTVPVGGSVYLSFPAQFDLINVAPADVAPTFGGTSTGTVTVTGNMIKLVIATADLEAGAQSIAIDDVINPDDSGEYYIGILTTLADGTGVDEGAAQAKIGNANDEDNANILVTAQLFQQCTMDLGAADIIDLGLLVLNTPALGQHLVTIDCNAETFTVNLTDEVTQFDNGVTQFVDASTAAANPTSETLASCVATNTEGCFGVHVSEDYADADLACDADLAEASEFAGLSDVTATTICNGSAPVDSASAAQHITVQYGAVAGADSTSGVYTDLITYVLTPSF